MQGGAVVESTLTLTAVPQILTRSLDPLQTSCTPGCGTGLPDIHFVVQDGAEKRSFDSSAYSLCPGLWRHPPDHSICRSAFAPAQGREPARGV